MSERDIETFNDCTARFGDWRGIDAVVFVHGIGGHFRETWGAFPELLASDPDLPELDILLWGYRTGYFPGSKHGTTSLGHNFVSELRLRLRTDAAAHLVAHSMGGLIVFQGLVDEMRCDRAQQPPTSSIHFISLFAVPTRGSSATEVAATLLKQFGLPKGILNDQIRSLGGQACDSLMAEVVRRIYEPSTDGPSARRIPIRMVMASNDATVDDEDSDMAHAPFQALPPLELDCGHSDVKLPTSHEDLRYLALAHDVQAMVAERFVETCQHCLNGGEDDCTAAEIDLESRYGGLLRRRFIDAGGRPDDDLGLYTDYVNLVMRDCARHGRPPFDAANRAVIVLRLRGYLGRAD